MLEFDQVDRDQDALPYEQIAHMLRQAITSGELAPGERLPAETKLAKTFGVARMTVRRAVQELRDEGLLVPAPGRRVA
ncbi:winged helix-turn-helix domain-containing protein, partial [Mycobacteroides abscessus]